MNEKNGNDIEGRNREWSAKDEEEYWRLLKHIKKNKIKKVFIFATIGMICLLLILRFPFIVTIITGICIALIGRGILIDTHGGDADSKPNLRLAGIWKTTVIAIPVLILIGFIALGTEHSLKANKSDVVGISRKFAISFIGGYKDKTLALCWDEQRKEIGEDFDRIRLLGDSFKNILEQYLVRVYPSEEEANLRTSLVAFSRLGSHVVCTYDTTVWRKPVFLNIWLLNGENLSVWDKFLRSIHSADYLNYLFPSPENSECWMVFAFKVDDEFEKVLKEELEDTFKDIRRRNLTSKFEDGKLNENEKKEYEKYEEENKEALERVKSTMKKFSSQDYREQLERNKVDFIGNWAANEIQRQLDQVKGWRGNLEKIFD